MREWRDPVCVCVSCVYDPPAPSRCNRWVFLRELIFLLRTHIYLITAQSTSKPWQSLSPKYTVQVYLTRTRPSTTPTQQEFTHRSWQSPAMSPSTGLGTRFARLDEGGDDSAGIYKLPSLSDLFTNDMDEVDAGLFGGDLENDGAYEEAVEGKKVIDHHRAPAENVPAAAQRPSNSHDHLSAPVKPGPASRSPSSTSGDSDVDPLWDDDGEEMIRSRRSTKRKRIAGSDDEAEDEQRFKGVHSREDGHADLDSDDDAEGDDGSVILIDLRGEDDTAPPIHGMPPAAERASQRPGSLDIYGLDLYDLYESDHDSDLDHGAGQHQGQHAAMSDFMADHYRQGAEADAVIRAAKKERRRKMQEDSNARGRSGFRERSSDSPGGGSGTIADENASASELSDEEIGRVKSKVRGRSKTKGKGKAKSRGPAHTRSLPSDPYDYTQGRGSHRGTSPISRASSGLEPAAARRQARPSRSVSTRMPLYLEDSDTETEEEASDGEDNRFELDSNDIDEPDVGDDDIRVERRRLAARPAQLPLVRRAQTVWRSFRRAGPPRIRPDGEAGRRAGADLPAEDDGDGLKGQEAVNHRYPPDDEWPAGPGGGGGGGGGRGGDGGGGGGGGAGGPGGAGGGPGGEGNGGPGGGPGGNGGGGGGGGGGAGGGGGGGGPGGPPGPLPALTPGDIIYSTSTDPAKTPTQPPANYASAPYPALPPLATQMAHRDAEHKVNFQRMIIVHVARLRNGVQGSQALLTQLLNVPYFQVEWAMLTTGTRGMCRYVQGPGWRGVEASSSYKRDIQPSEHHWFQPEADMLTHGTGSGAFTTNSISLDWRCTACGICYDSSTSYKTITIDGDGYDEQTFVSCFPLAPDLCGD